MQQRDDLLLKRRFEVNEQVAAGDQVEARKRRVADHAVRREDAHLAQILDQTIRTRFGDEEALEPVGRDPLDQVDRTARRARDTPIAASSMSVAKICTLGAAPSLS